MQRGINVRCTKNDSWETSAKKTCWPGFSCPATAGSVRMNYKQRCYRHQVDSSFMQPCKHFVWTDKHRQWSFGWLTNWDDHSQNSYCQVLAQEEILASSCRGRLNETEELEWEDEKTAEWERIRVRKRMGLKKNGWEIEWAIRRGGRKAELVEERGDKTQRLGAGDHACRAVSVLQRETERGKKVRIKIKEWWGKMMRWLTFARVWPWHYTWPSTRHPSRLHQALNSPHSSQSVTFHKLIYIHLHKSMHALVDMQHPQPTQSTIYEGDIFKTTRYHPSLLIKPVECGFWVIYISHFNVIITVRMRLLATLRLEDVVIGRRWRRSGESGALSEDWATLTSR